MRRILEEISRRYQGKALGAHLKTGEVFPTDVVPAMAPVRTASGESQPSVRLMQWGMTNPYSASVIINARAESAAEKPMFRQAVRQGRVLLPANAFYEWQKQDESRSKTRYRISVPGDGFFYMAGLYRPERLSPDEAVKLYGPGALAAGTSNEAGQGHAVTIDRFVIITMPASPMMSVIHDRMPLILAREAARSWLLDPVAALAMLAAPAASPLETVRMD